jgi:hypothetical protein
MNILRKTMDEMPNVFTSNHFNKRAILNGYPKKKIVSTGTSNFVKKLANNEYYGSKTWVKKKVIIKKEYNPNHYKAKTLTEDEAVLFLKEKGYKILKPINKWEEI